MESSNVSRPKLPSVGELFSHSWQFYKAHWRKIFFTIAIWYIVVLVFLLLMAGSFTALGDDLSALIMDDALPQVDLAYIPLAVFGVLTLIVSLLGYIALFYVVGQPGYSIKEAYQKATKKLLLFIGLTIVLGIVLLIGFIAAIIPGIIFMAWFSLSVFVLLSEERGIFASLTQSKRYVKGYFWAVVGRYFGIGLILVFPVLILSGLIELAANVDENIYALNFFVDLFSTFVLTPLCIIYMWHLYGELKGRTELVPVA